MEFLKPLQRRLAYGVGRQGFRLGESRQSSWNIFRGWRSQQTASLHRRAYTRQARDFFWRIKWSRSSRNVRWQSSKPAFNPTENLGSPEPSSLSDRMKKLSREYGWSALGVYLGLSALDFPLCFLAVRWLGTEKIGHWEDVAIDRFWKGLESIYPGAHESVTHMFRKHGSGDDETAREGGGQGVEKADSGKKSDMAGLWTQIALAYALHKSLIVFRVPLTAAVTPKVVKTLRGWGWNIGKRRPKA